MGEKDLYQSDFYEDSRRFADAFNGSLFQGKQVVRAEELEEADGELIGFMEAGEEEGKAHKVIRDKVKKWRGTHFAILVIENQSQVDYGMVLRVMKAEALGYEKQKKAAYRKAKEKGVSFTSAEYISRMKREEKFIPIITLVVYLGVGEAWDGARSLYELLKLDERLKPYVNNHRLNLYDLLQSRSNLFSNATACGWWRMRPRQLCPPTRESPWEPSASLAVSASMRRKTTVWEKEEPF